MLGVGLYILVIGVAIGMTSIGWASPIAERQTNTVRPSGAFVLTGFFILVLFQGTRYYVGTDYATYSELFALLQPGDLDASIKAIPQEPVFTLLAYVVSAAGGSFQLFTVVVAALTVGAVIGGLALMGLSIPAGLAFYCLFGLYTQGFNIMRQSLSIALVFLAYAFWVKSMVRYKALAVAVGVLSVGVHASAVVPISALIVIGLSVAARILACLAISGALGVYGLGSSLALLTGGTTGDRYLQYLEGDKFSLGKIVLLCFYAAVFSLALFAQRKLRLGAASRRELSMLGIGAAIVLLSLTTPYIERVAFYFLVFGCAFFARLSRVSSCSQGDRKRRLLLLQAVYILGACYLLLTVTRYGNLLPYSSWLH